MRRWLMNERVAGHLFVDTPRGEACSECGKLWIDVLNTRELWRAGEPNIAHSGCLTTDEVATLQAKLQRIWDAGMRF